MDDTTEDEISKMNEIVQKNFTELDYYDVGEGRAFKSFLVRKCKSSISVFAEYIQDLRNSKLFTKVRSVKDILDFSLFDELRAKKPADESKRSSARMSEQPITHTINSVHTISFSQDDYMRYGKLFMGPVTISFLAIKDTVEKELRKKILNLLSLYEEQHGMGSYLYEKYFQHLVYRGTRKYRAMEEVRHEFTTDSKFLEYYLQKKYKSVLNNLDINVEYRDPRQDNEDMLFLEVL